MRIVKASALALIVTASLSMGPAMAADAPAGHHPWVHSGKHPICELLLAIFTFGHHHKHHANVVSVSY
jgi:hypothetical protein